MNIKRIRDLTDKDYLILKDVYLYITNSKLYSTIIYDDNTRYICNYDSDNIEQCAISITPPNVKNTNFIEIDKAFSCLFQQCLPPSHQWIQFFNIIDYFLNYKIDNMLIYDTSNNFYNKNIEFITQHIGNVKQTYKCKQNTLYKVKELTLAVRSKKSYEYYLVNHNLLSKKLDEIIPVLPKEKYFNIKIQKNKEDNCTPARSFTNDEYICSIMAKYNYKQLDTSSEFNKQTNLRNSSFLIINWGGNHHITMPSLFGKNKNILVLCHIAYQHEYGNSPMYKLSVNKIRDDKFCQNNVRWVFDVPNEIENLDKIIEDFERDYENFNTT